MQGKERRRSIISIMLSTFYAFCSLFLVAAGLGVPIGGSEQIMPPVVFLVSGIIVLAACVRSIIYTLRTGQPYF